MQGLGSPGLVPPPASAGYVDIARRPFSFGVLYETAAPAVSTSREARSALVFFSLRGLRSIVPFRTGQQFTVCNRASSRAWPPRAWFPIPCASPVSNHGGFIQPLLVHGARLHRAFVPPPFDRRACTSCRCLSARATVGSPPSCECRQYRHREKLIPGCCLAFEGRFSLVPR